MENKRVQEVLNWMRTTDLAEVSFRRGGEGLELRLEGTPPEIPAFPGSALVPVTSPEVGLFRWNAPGAPRRVEKGVNITEGDACGVVESATKKHVIKAPASGKVTAVAVEEGKAVEYGQPLFFIHPG